MFNNEVPLSELDRIVIVKPNDNALSLISMAHYCDNSHNVLQHQLKKKGFSLNKINGEKILFLQEKADG